jgi:SAM-dependent methyltransferase
VDPKAKRDLQQSYDRVAAEYEARIYDELRHKPFDRELLDRFAARVRDLGPVCDVGCGPGQVARYLHDRGVKVCGLDLSPAMVERARRLSPEIEFVQGDMTGLTAADESWSGITAFYSVIHVPRPEVARALCELRRVLRPGGVLVLAFHIGDEVLHLEEWLGQQVSVDFAFFRPEEMRGYLEEAGFVVEEVLTREPYPDVEHPTRRAYLVAVKGS